MMDSMDRIDTVLDRREADELAEWEELQLWEAPACCALTGETRRMQQKEDRPLGKAGASLFAGCDTLEQLRAWLTMGNRVWQATFGRPA